MVKPTIAGPRFSETYLRCETDSKWGNWSYLGQELRVIVMGDL